MKLLWNLVRNDICKNKIMSIVLTLFLLLSAILMAGGLHLTGVIISSTNGLNRLASPPDFFQMHKGEYDAKQIEEFGSGHAYLKKNQVVSMLNIANANIMYNGETLENCLMDNGFVVQNKEFDYLLDINNEIASVQDGEIGVPVYYYEELGIQLGDTLEILDGEYRKKFTVTTLIRDAQMNASLTSSKRFLVSESDHQDLSAHTGEWEYSFEYLLEPGTEVSKLESDYINEKMPSNGVAIPGGLLNILNSLSYGLTAILLLSISFILILIALLCLSYIIRATLVEEARTIGAMKAIGLSAGNIKKLYLMKYSILSLVACVVGYLIAIPFGNLCAGSVILYCGEGVMNWMQWIFPIVGLLILEGIILLCCQRMIRRNLRSTVVELLRDEEHIKKEGRFKLPKRRKMNKNLTMALGELGCKWKEYIVLFFVFTLASFLIIVPINMQNTVQDRSFISYMGVGECDIRIDIQKGSNPKETIEALKTALANDHEVAKVTVFQNGFVKIQNQDEWEYLRIMSGDESVFPLRYLEGNAPDRNQTRELAISYMEASELGLKVGNLVPIKHNNEIQEYMISGIYQDVTYSGKTGKATLTFSENATEGYVIYLTVKEGVPIVDKAKELREIAGGGRVTPVGDFVHQTLGGIIDNVGTVIIASVVLALLLVGLITTMYLQLITAREHSAIAIKKSIGFQCKDIRIQLGIRIFVIQLAAIICGTIFAILLGGTLFGALLSSFGAAKITLVNNVLVTGVLSPAIQLVICFITIIIATKSVEKYHIRNQIME